MVGAGLGIKPRGITRDGARSNLTAEQHAERLFNKLVGGK